MKKTLLTCAIAPLLLSVTASADVQMLSEAGESGQAQSQSRGGNVLYDQIGLTPSGNGAPDQNFEASYDAYDAVVADDFMVDGDGWNVTQIDMIGTTSGGDAVSVNVSFHADAGGSPNPTPLSGCTFTAATIVSQAAGAFTVDLGAGCDIPPGVNWMAFQTNQDFAVSGQHFFSNTQTITGNEGHFMNPGDGFGSGCTTFMPAGTTCAVGGAFAQDYLFSLSGSMLPPRIVPVNNWFGLSLLLLGVGFFSRRYIKQD